MSMSNLSIDGEFRYIIQWFNEWSELQRDDFVYVLVEYLARGCSTDVGGAGADGGGGGVYVNGLVNSLANAGVQDKPMSLFQCRIKLFREWSPKWPIEFKCKLQEKIGEIDAKVGEKIINELRGSHGVHNGDVAVHLNANGATSDDGGGLVEHELEQPAVAVVEAEVTALTPPPVVVAEPAPEAEADNDNRLAAVLSQETPVDDDDDDNDVEEEPRTESVGNSTADVNGHYPAAAVTTIAVNTSPSPSPAPSHASTTPAIVEPVEQVENSVTVTVAAPAAEVPPVA